MQSNKKSIVISLRFSSLLIFFAQVRAEEETGNKAEMNALLSMAVKVID